MSYPHPLSGLYCRPHPEHSPTPAAAPAPVPLLGVSVEAELAGASSKVVLAQRFKNVEARPIEAVYLFPLPTDAAVCGFSAEVDGRRIEGRVEEREKAFEIYDDAMADGHGAYLLDQERPNVFTLSVGNLAPGAEVVVRLSWVALVPWEGDAVRFTVPTTVSPRYAPAASTPEIGQPDADKLDPERRASVPYGLTLRLEVDGAVKRVESPTHPIRTALSPVVVELAQREVALDRDVVIVVEPAVAKVPSATVARDTSGNRYVQIAFVPDFPKSNDGAEVVFLVDCSGSMGGDSIAEARRALELCVRALDLRDSFDVVRFGSTFESLFGAARAFDDQSLAAAVAFARATDANLGGTEIMAPLAAILERPLAPGRTRQVLLLTDGQVSNEADVIELARRHADKARVFAFGIGAGVSEHLVREVARASRGEVEMIAPGERVEPKVLRQFVRVRSPVLGDIKLDWGGLEVEQAPRAVPPVFEGEPLVVWAKVRAGAASEVALSGGGRRWVVPLDLERAVASGPVPALWGRAAIRDLEADDGRHGSSQQRPGRGDRKRDKLVELGRELGLVSSATSYVAVELRAESERTKEKAELRRVPIALTHGWGEIAAPRPSGYGAPTTAMPAPPAPAARHMKRAAAPARGAMPAGMPPPAPISAAPPSSFDAMPMEPMPMAEVSAKKGGGPMKDLLARAASAVGAVAAGAAGAAGALAGRVHKSASKPATGKMLERELGARSEASVPEAGEEAFVSGDFDDGVGADAGDALYAILLTQGASGAFAESPALLRHVRDAAALEALVAAHGREVVLTALALAVFARAFGDRQGEWRAAADKANRYLAGRTIDVSSVV